MDTYTLFYPQAILFAHMHATLLYTPSHPVFYAMGWVVLLSPEKWDDLFEVISRWQAEQEFYLGVLSSPLPSALQPLFWPEVLLEGWDLLDPAHPTALELIPIYFTFALRKPSQIQILFLQGFIHPEEWTKVHLWLEYIRDDYYYCFYLIKKGSLGSYWVDGRSASLLCQISPHNRPVGTQPPSPEGKSTQEWTAMESALCSLSAKHGATSHQPRGQALTFLLVKWRCRNLVWGLWSRLSETMHRACPTHSVYSVNVSWCLFGMSHWIKTSLLLSWMRHGSLICPLRTVLHSISIFSTQFYAISSTALQIILNYPSASLGLERFKFFLQIIY